MNYVMPFCPKFNSPLVMPKRPFHLQYVPLRNARANSPPPPLIVLRNLIMGTKALAKIAVFGGWVLAPLFYGTFKRLVYTRLGCGFFA